MRVFLDGNILFLAATSPGGRALALFRLAETGRFTLCASSHVIEEARRNVATRSHDQIGELERLVGQIEHIAEAPAKLVVWAGEHDLAANDAPVLASAVAAGADGLVTGDRSRFGHLFGQVLGGVTVAPTSEALKYFLNRATK